MKRDLIDEIVGIRDRTHDESKYLFFIELLDLLRLLDEDLTRPPGIEKGILKFIPINIVACFEAYFRSIIKDLIDFGEPYRKNAIKFNQVKNIKFDFEIINAIDSDKVTIGEFISHILSCNNLEDINLNMSTIIGFDFLSAIKNYVNNSVHSRVRKNKKDEFTVNSNQIIKDIVSIFEYRHIFCHEFSVNVSLEKEDAKRFLNNAVIFLNQVDDYMLYLLFPNAPQTQTEMNIASSKNFKLIEKEYENVIHAIKNKSGSLSDMDSIDLDLLDTMIKHWKVYRKSKAELEASCVQGGTMYSMVYADSLISTTRLEILRLEKTYKLKKISN